eukprot:302942-Prorocentrum_lima.AAC.1
MTSSLVGSEMCIRDRKKSEGLAKETAWPRGPGKTERERHTHTHIYICLLYTSDAAEICSV